MTKKPPFDWYQFWIHFVFGAIMGCVLGLSAIKQQLWTISSFYSQPVLVVITISIITGLLAGLYRDDFWSNFSDFYDDYRKWIVVGIVMITLLFAIYILCF